MFENLWLGAWKTLAGLYKGRSLYIDRRPRREMSIQTGRVCLYQGWVYTPSLPWRTEIAGREHFLSYQSCARNPHASHGSKLILYCIDQDVRLIEWLMVDMNFVYPRRSSIAIYRTSVESHPNSKQKERMS